MPATDFPWLDPAERRVLKAFMRPARALFVEFDREMEAEVGLSRVGFEILFHLHDAPDRTMRMHELATAAGYQPSRITQAVSSLERAGAVRRELCVADRRGWNAVLTDEGATLLATAAPLYAALARRQLLEPLTSEQRDHLVDIGETLLAHLDQTRARASTLGMVDA
jgi:DNA-binding MarR family transcriptional regulator